MTDLSRRSFLRGAALAGAAAFLPNSALQDKDPKSLAKIFEGATLTDQYGKSFDPSELFKNRNALVLFGFGGCQMCQKIGVTVAAIQSEIDARNAPIVEANKKLPVDQKKPLIDLPIVVISVLPADDRFKESKDNPMKAYVESYDSAGVRQVKDKGVSYENGKDMAQKDRILHIVTSQDGTLEKDYNVPQTIQLRLAKIFPPTNRFLPSDPKSHSPYITLFKNNMAVQTERALPGMSKIDNAASMEAHAKTCAKTLVDAALAQQQSRGR